MSAPYTVVIDGVSIQCDSPEAAIALVRAHGGAAPTKPTAQRGQGGPNNTRWTAQRVKDFFKHLEGKNKQTRLINVLLDTEDARTDDQLLQALSLTNGMELAGVFAGLYKNAKKAGADPNELYLKRNVTIGDKRGSEYSLHPGFRAAAVGHRAK